MSAIMTDLARVIAKDHLVGNEARWRHTIGVAARAEEFAVTVPPEDRETLIAAAWLHDIGYSEALVETGFHPLDGAAYLDRTGWPPRIAALVAHHSGSAVVADLNGLRHALAFYPHEVSPLADALTYADQTTGPLGQRVDIRTRIDEVLRRHGPGSMQARAHAVRGPYLLAIADRVTSRLRSSVSV
jgi:putative nucleotidyltransferase with HDIG domain